MFCPVCKSEFREGFDFCNDCQVSLVEAMVVEPEADSPENELMLLAESTHPTFIEDLVERLEAASIPYVAQSGTALSLSFGPNPLSETLPEDWKAIVWVVGSSEESAQKILAELNRQYESGSQSAES